MAAKPHAKRRIAAAVLGAAVIGAVLVVRSLLGGLSASCFLPAAAVGRARDASSPAAVRDALAAVAGLVAGSPAAWAGDAPSSPVMRAQMQADTLSKQFEAKQLASPAAADNMDINSILIGIAVVVNAYFFYNLIFTTTFDKKRRVEDKRRGDIASGKDVAARLVQKINNFGKEDD
eukprot:TRINITY_DN8297_c1_g1_i1.p1 TRINITY_DN8297_c1_g1~~TRINITY_DN8297_c1_g1_i1.p1  ORF type:complete len:176 (-),score=53.69 TRINITY_DN8297_c1_g1_i1:78-605(-)